MPKKIRRNRHVLMMDRVNWTELAIQHEKQDQMNQKLLQEQMENEELFMKALAQREPDAMSGDQFDSVTVNSDTNDDRDEEEEEDDEEEEEEEDNAPDDNLQGYPGYVFEEAQTSSVVARGDEMIQDETLDITTLTSSRTSYRKAVKPSEEELEAIRREKKLQRAAQKEARRQRRKEKKENKKRSWKKRKKEQNQREREIVITGV
eukprot:CAMPEP_0170183268 /NCGR_PEP_ID=MMETSP0040_2-20121228/30168_1 /TAXON_ID=641309 /ORGANISM="Lotharella oceanica, Strain CCMP622" /LENGTH=204 /DNA_ID=CAMNT_0010428945 /DNA_START=35 /DNA_END=649 /DNA_ORIENTATION=-